MPRNHSDYFSSRFPLDTVTGLDVKSVRNRFWHRYLELARHLTHVLTISRTLSLSSFHCRRALNIARLRKQYGGRLPLTLRRKDRLELFFERRGHGQAFDDHAVQGAPGDRI